jgi:hypothetical protein
MVIVREFFFLAVATMLACRLWVLALLALVLYVGRADAGVTIETIKEGDGVNFPTVGKSIKVCISERFLACKDRAS